ncbi:YraN family protein [Clostridiaceae bacterium M8S5]|nr:YraN family protein [Clostridiaceae bacterium M8S5]
MKTNNKEQGQKGEDIAIKYLKKLKYKILERNYAKKTGEIDIIAKDKEIVVFIEVKARKSDNYGNPSDAVNTAKQKNIIKTALLYQSINKLNNTQFRFDIVEVFMHKKDKINHLINAFWID